MRRATVRVGAAELAAVAALLALATGLRFWRLDLGWFGVDQARDIQTGLDLAAGRDFPTVGPTMRRVTSLGALYHYVWALPHLVSEDPLAAYRFAAVLGVVTAIATWWYARRRWDGRAALVALAVFACSRVAVLDGRVAWAPAALPLAAIVLLAMLDAPPTPLRLALLGATLGIAVQLHLAMVAWVAAAMLLVLARGPSLRALGAGIVGLAVTGFPAAYAALANAGRDAGITTLPGRGPLPSIGGRLWAAWSLEWRVPPAFWQWPDAPEPWPLATRTAAVVIAGAVVLGIVRSMVAALRGDRAATVLVTVIACQLGMVVLLPGEAWYYYLDALLPLSALAAGACVATAPGAAHRLAAAAATTLVAAALVSGVASARWLANVATHGYVALQPAALTLDGTAGRDASIAGRLLTLGVKREVATLLGAEPATMAARWASVHGPAFDDLTGDNGFWLGGASVPSSASAPPRHAVVWYRDDPSAPSGAAPGFDLVDVGPLRIARYQPTIDYGTCRDDADRPIVVPIRVVPAPRRYGDGTIARPSTLPTRVTCDLAAGQGGTRVVAAVTHGTVVLRGGDGTTSRAAPITTLCVRRGEQPTPITITTDGATASDLDLWERPDAACDPGKIAP